MKVINFWHGVLENIHLDADTELSTPWDRAELSVIATCTSYITWFSDLNRNSVFSYGLSTKHELSLSTLSASPFGLLTPSSLAA